MFKVGDLVRCKVDTYRKNKGEIYEVFDVDSNGYIQIYKTNSNIGGIWDDPSQFEPCKENNVIKLLNAVDAANK